MPTNYCGHCGARLAPEAIICPCCQAAVVESNFNPFKCENNSSISSHRQEGNECPQPQEAIAQENLQGDKCDDVLHAQNDEMLNQAGKVYENMQASAKPLQSPTQGQIPPQFAEGGYYNPQYIQPLQKGNLYAPPAYNYQPPAQGNGPLPIKTTVLYLFLNSIPVFGIVFMLIIAFGSNPKYTTGHKNLAKALIIVMCIGIAFVVVAYLIMFILLIIVAFPG